MEIGQIQSFLAVAECLNFSKAAEKVFLSQPAVSQQVRLMEKELGVALFSRGPHRIELTPAGKICREQLQCCVRQLERMTERTRLAAEGKFGQLRVGFISTAAVDIVPRLVNRFRETHPQVRLELRDNISSALMHMLEQRQMDVAFLRMPFPSSGLLRHAVIHEEPFRLFLPGGHPLAGKQAVRLRELNDQPFLAYARKSAPGYHDLLMGKLTEFGVRPSLIHEAKDMYTLVSMVSAGMGATIAPASIARYGIPNIAVRDIADDFPPSQIAMAFHSVVTSPVISAFLDAALLEKKQRRPAAPEG